MIQWDVKLRRSIVNAGEWTLLVGYLYDENGNQVHEQEVWLRINNELTKGHVTEFNRFRFYVRIRDPGLYVLQPTIFGIMSGNYKMVVEGPRLLLMVLPKTNTMVHKYDVRFYKKITLKEILPKLKIIHTYVKLRYPHITVYLRSGIVTKGYSWHDVDFLIQNANDREFRAIKSFIEFILPVNMDVWRYEEYNPPTPRVVVPLEEVLKNTGCTAMPHGGV